MLTIPECLETAMINVSMVKKSCLFSLKYLLIFRWTIDLKYNQNFVQKTNCILNFNLLIKSCVNNYTLVTCFFLHPEYLLDLRVKKKSSKDIITSFVSMHLNKLLVIIALQIRVHRQYVPYYIHYKRTCRQK